MRLETIMSSYSVPDRPQVGYLEAVLSPDGWEQSSYHHMNGRHLMPDEIVEFTSLATGFFHECKTQNDLKKFCKKHGTDTDAVTSSFRFDCALMSYCVHVTGYSAVFAPYRKENV